MYTNTITFFAFGLLSSLTAPVDAYWRMPCDGTLLTGRLDPVVAPGAVSGHTHIILGGNGFAPTMDYASTQASTCTSCSIQGDFSNYWVPSLYYAGQNGTFTSVETSGGTVYYEQRVTYPGKNLTAFPKGFRMTAGNPELRAYNTTEQQEAISHVCLNYAGGGPPQSPGFPTVNCPDGLRSQVYFPSCWDGVNLDSPDHQSHMAYPLGGHPDGGQCPDDHPVPMISIFYEFIFNTGDFAADWYPGVAQPFVFSMGDSTGYGFHGDFVNGWDVQLLQNAINEFTTDNAGDADNVYYNNYFTAPAVSGQQCSLPPMVNEQVTGLLDALPGCNPVTNTPGPVSDCAATKTLGTYTSSIFTDETSKGWAYLGCGVDTYGNPALQGPFQDDATMTVETCIALCGGKDFSIAGLEYASQCFCGNDLPARASPTPGVIGGCNMACTGNSTEMCGAGSRLSLYQKCGSTCENAQFGIVGAGGTVPSVTAVPVTNAPASTSAVSAPSGVSTASVVSVSASSSSSSATTATATTGSDGTGSGDSVATSPVAVAPVLPSATPSAILSVVASAASSAAASAAPSAEPSACPSNSTTSSVTLPSGWTSAGCYLDNMNPRSLSGITFAWWGEQMTSSGCALYCSDKGFSYAGTENAGQCFCGNQLVDSQLEPDTACNLPCEGSATEMCGGPARLSVFTNIAPSTRRRRSHLRRHNNYKGAHFAGASA
ncbi:hypothetical protein MMC11_006158 [Xylographa trunciseda]|nr:hypothetical protein [Xylographa trunciseda]